MAPGANIALVETPVAETGGVQDCRACRTRRRARLSAAALRAAASRPVWASTPNPLLRLQIFSDRGFAVETLVLGLISIVFVLFFFFASVYAQVSLHKDASNAGLYLMYFFIGFVIMAQVGGRTLDRRGASWPW
jgi:hypothetical protein